MGLGTRQDCAMFADDGKTFRTVRCPRTGLPLSFETPQSLLLGIMRQRLAPKL